MQLARLVIHHETLPGLGKPQEFLFSAIPSQVTMLWQPGSVFERQSAGSYERAILDLTTLLIAL